MDSLCFHIITNGNPDRIETTRTAFETYGLKFQWEHSDKHPTNGKRGCFLSHIKLFRHAKKEGMEYIAIAEDNLIQMHDRIPSSVAREVAALLPTNEWGLVLLGGWFVPFSSYGARHGTTLYKTSSIHGTSCYIIHRRLYLSILEHYKPHLDEHIDAYLMNASPCSYIVAPLLFRRNNTTPTSNTYFSNTVVNWFYYINCSRAATVWWEFYSIHALSIQTVFLVLVLLFLLWWWYRRARTNDTNDTNDHDTETPHDLNRLL